MFISRALTAKLSMADAGARELLIAEIVADQHARVIADAKRRIKRNPEKGKGFAKEAPDFNPAPSFSKIHPDADATQNHQLRAQTSGISHQSQRESGGSGVQAVPFTADAARLEATR